MLDTIRVKYPINPTNDQLKHWTCRTTTTETGEKKVYIYNPVVNDTSLRFTYYPIGYNNQPLLTLEVSLPKLVLGNNFMMLKSINQSIQSANLRLTEIPHIPRLDLAEGILIRLDMCYNHQVGDAVEDYIKAIGKLDYPHRRTKHHRYEGVEFRAKHKTTKFYDKEHESGYIEAHGILRQETTLINGKDIQKFLGKKQPTLLDIDYLQIAEFLKDDLAKIGLLNNSIATRDTALKSLCNEHGKYAGVYYFALLDNRVENSKKKIAQQTGMHPRSLDRKLRKIVKAGIPLTLTDREEPLPPLVINHE